MSPPMLIWLAASMGLLVSPDHLRLWGNLAGHIGSGFWMVAVGAAAIYSLSVNSYRRLAQGAADSGGYLAGLRMKAGTPAVALALASRLTLTLGISTGVLVTSGFVFNETFVYWFPNFAFAFVCLGGVTLALLLGYQVAERVQTVLLAIALLGLMALVASAIWQAGPHQAKDPLPPSGYGMEVVFSGLLLFVGFDLNIHRSDHQFNDGAGKNAMLAALILTAVVLSLWGTVSLEYVEARRLSESFIPFTLAARQIGGQTGRILIGIVVIAGTGCAVIALFSATARMASSLAGLDLLPRFCLGSDRRNLPVIVILAAAVAAMMATGFAGEPELETFIRAGFLLWMLHVAMVHLASLMIQDSNMAVPAKVGRGAWTGGAGWLRVPTAILLGTGAVCLWFSDADRWLLLNYMVTVWFGGAVVIVLVRLTNRQTMPPAA